MEITLGPGTNVLRKLNPPEKKAAPKKVLGFGGVNPLAAIMDSYEQAERGF